MLGEGPVLRSDGDRVGQEIECGRARRGRTTGDELEVGEDAAKVTQRQVGAKIYVVAQEAGGEARPRRVVL